MSSRARICTSVRCEPTRALCFFVRLYGGSPKKGFVWCEPTRALYCVLVVVDQGFVLLCTSVRCEPKKRLCAVRTHKGLVQCAGNRPPRLCNQCFVLVRARVQISEPVPLYGASPQGLCASVYGCSVRTQMSFFQREPTRALYSVLVLAPQSVLPSAYVLVRARMQMSSCTSICTPVRYKATIYLCFCAGGCADELMLLRNGVL